MCGAPASWTALTPWADRLVLEPSRYPIPTARRQVFSGGGERKKENTLLLSRPSPFPLFLDRRRIGSRGASIAVLGPPFLCLLFPIVGKIHQGIAMDFGAWGAEDMRFLALQEG